VCWHPGARKWQAATKLNRKEIYIGLFDDEGSAARAYDAVALRMRGTLAATNFTYPEDEKNRIIPVAHHLPLQACDDRQIHQDPD